MFKKSIYFVMVAVSCLAVLSCGGNTITIDKDSPVVANLSALRLKGPSGASMLLAQAAPFEWDTVFLFFGATRKAQINEIVGQKIFGSGKGYFADSDTKLLVFKVGDRVVHAAVTYPPVYLGGDYDLPHSREEAVIQATTKDPGPYGLRLVRK